MLDSEALTDFLDQWMLDQGVPMHSTTLERIVDGVIEFEGEKRSHQEWLDSAS